MPGIRSTSIKLYAYWWIHKKVENQWSTGEAHRAALAISGSTMPGKMPMLYHCLCRGDLRLPWIMQGSAFSL